MTEPHCKIGRVRLKNGAHLYVLPDAKERETEKALKEFDRAASWVREFYDKDLRGFVVNPWNAAGQFNCFQYHDCLSLSRNTLPYFVAEAVRRDNSEWEARFVIDKIFE